MGGGGVAFALIFATFFVLILVTDENSESDSDTEEKLKGEDSVGSARNTHSTAQAEPSVVVWEDRRPSRCPGWVSHE